MSQEAQSSLPTTRLPNFSPATPIPLQFDLEKHLRYLYSRLDPQSPNYERPEQHRNLRKLIELYENGTRKDDSQVIHIMGGEIVSREIAHNTYDWCLTEVRIPLIFHQERYQLTNSEQKRYRQ